MSMRFIRLSVATMLLAVSSMACTEGEKGCHDNSPPCPPGSYSVEYEDCKKCPAGEFHNANSPNAGLCEICPAGTFSHEGASDCIPCEAGAFQPVAHSNSCTLCPAGTYSTLGASGCTACPPDTYAPTAGSYSCTHCPDGYHSPAHAVRCTIWLVSYFINM